MEITILAALDERNVIGNNGNVPWDNREHEKRVIRKIAAHTAMMGRIRYESMEKHSLQARNIVLTSKRLASPLPLNVYPVHSVEQAKSLALDLGLDVYVIGGAKTYKSFFPLANRLELTHIRGKHIGDKVFPKINLDEWAVTNKEHHETHYFATYTKRR